MTKPEVRRTSQEEGTRGEQCEEECPEHGEEQCILERGHAGEHKCVSKEHRAHTF